MTHIVLHRTPRTVADSDTLIALVIIPAQCLKYFPSSNKLIFHLAKIGMIFKRESSELRNVCRPSKIPNSEAGVAQSKILTIPVHDLALEIVASSALGVLIGTIVELRSARLAIFISEDGGAWLEDHPDGTVCDDTIENIVISSFEIVAKFSLENAVEKLDMCLGLGLMVCFQGLNEVLPAMYEWLKRCTESQSFQGRSNAWVILEDRAKYLFQ